MWQEIQPTNQSVLIQSTNRPCAKKPMNPAAHRLLNSMNAARRSLGLVQTCDVVRYGFDLAIIQFCRYFLHLHAISPHTIAKRRQLRCTVIGMLATQSRVLCRYTGTVGAVTTRASRDLSIRNTTTVYPLTHCHQVFVGGRAAFRLFGGDEVRHVLHILVGQHAGKTLHDGIGALVGLELLQLLNQVLRVLLSQCRIAWCDRISICAMAGDTCCKRGFAFGQIGFADWFACGTTLRYSSRLCI